MIELSFDPFIRIYRADNEVAWMFILESMGHLRPQLAYIPSPYNRYCLFTVQFSILVKYWALVHFVWFWPTFLICCIPYPVKFQIFFFLIFLFITIILIIWHISVSIDDYRERKLKEAILENYNNYFSNLERYNYLKEIYNPRKEAAKVRKKRKFTLETPHVRKEAVNVRKKRKFRERWKKKVET